MLSTHTIQLPHLHSVAVALAVRGGPRYEGPENRGLTHFLEHMLFRGAGTLTPRGLMAAFEEVGGEPDAYTSEDALVIHLEEVAPTRLERALELLASVLLAPRYEDLENERDIILEEFLDRSHEIDDLERGLAFGGHSLGRSILGQREDIEGCQVDDLERWRRKLVSMHNVALVVAGPVSPERVADACSVLGELPPGEPLADLQPAPAPGAMRTSFQGLVGPQTEVRLSFRGPGESDPSNAALRVLSDVLDGGPTGRIPEQLVDRGLAYDAAASLLSLPDLSQLALDVTCANGKLTRATEALLGIVRGMREGVEPEELERARLRRSHLRRTLQDDGPAQAEWSVRRLLFGLPTDRQAFLASEDAVGPNELAALAREVFVPGRLSAVVLGSPGKKTSKRTRQIIESM